MRLEGRQFDALRLLRDTWRDISRRGSTGLRGLDLRLIEAIGGQRDGYFVELGANDGVRQANTYLLQKRFGWTGLLIEPHPARFEACVRNRAFGRRPSVVCAACVPADYGDRFVELECSDLMSVARGMDLDDEAVFAHADKGAQFLGRREFRYSHGALARTLTSLLDEASAPQTIDLISLDVEGNELSVLRGLDLEKYSPTWVLIEVRDAGVVDFILSNGFEEVAKLSEYSTYSDTLFRRVSGPAK